MVKKLKNTTYYPTTFIIFGATGDLSKKKLIPSIYRLFDHGLLPDDISFVGISVEELDSKSFQKFVINSVKTFAKNKGSLKNLKEFAMLFSFVAGDFTKEETYRAVKEHLHGVDTKCENPHQTVFYMAVAPQFFIPIIKLLDDQDLTGPCKEYDIKAKVVIEKPFGRDSDTADELNQALLEYADEEQIYRMDHYLGKETVQNILLFRFTNPVINDSWNPGAIDKIVVTASEDIGVEQRAGYYDTAGALRDMLQSHCLALLSLVLMDEPHSLASADIHKQKKSILESLSLYRNTDLSSSAIRGQYEGYLDIPEISNDSMTETFAALRLKSAHPKWKNVPFYLQSGKRLDDKSTTISIHFAPCSSNICKTEGIKTEPNILNIRVQPDEGIDLQLYAKKPGFSVLTEQINMDFLYKNSFVEEQPSPYERLIHDVIIGDQSLFPSTDEVMEQWRIIQPVLNAWKDSTIPLYKYEKGSSGPKAINQLMK